MSKSIDSPSGLFRQKSRFISVNALVFYRELEKAVADRAIICVNVHVSKLLQPQKGLSAVEQRVQMEKINHLHLDFVLCAKHNFAVIAGIQAVESGKANFAEQTARALLDDACASANLPLIRIEYQTDYDQAHIKLLIDSVLPKEDTRKNPNFSGLQSEHATTDSDFIELPEPTETTATQPLVKPQNPSATKSSKNTGQIIDSKPCPKCKSKLAVRTAKSGKNKGARYLVCTEYPICSFITLLKAPQKR